MLRYFAVAACQRARGGDGSPDHPQLRARRGLVLQLPDQCALRRRSRTRAAAASPGRPARAGARRPGPQCLAATPALRGQSWPWLLPWPSPWCSPLDRLAPVTTTVVPTGTLPLGVTDSTRPGFWSLAGCHDTVT